MTGAGSGGFGCARCYGPEPVRPPGLRHVRVLLDESHFVVSLLRCPACGQQFVSIFTEVVDWAGGDDAQYRDLVPVTGEEAAALIAQGESLDPRLLGGLGAGRRRLSTEWPTGGERTVAWRTGVFSIRPGH